MADIDIDPFGEHGTDETTDETFPLIPTGGRTDGQIDTGSGEKETSYTLVLRDQVDGVYDRLSETLNQRPEVTHTDLFEIRDGELYFHDKNDPLTRNGQLRPNSTLERVLGKTRLREMGFDIPKGNFSAKQATILNKIGEDLPSSSKVSQATDLELETISKDVIDSNEDLISLIRESVDNEATQTDDLFEYPLRELIGLDREMKTIRGSLKVEISKKTMIEQHIEREQSKLEEMANDTIYTDEQRDEVKDRMQRLNDDLKTRKESIDILKGKLTSQITSIKETIAKLLDKDTTLGEKIRTLFREQGITIVSVLTAFGMVIGFLVETLLPSGSGATSQPKNPDKKGSSSDVKEWIKNKIKALGSLLGRLAAKAAEALPGIIGSIVAWLLNTAKSAVGWLSQNLWALIVCLGGLIYTYFMTRR